MSGEIRPPMRWHWALGAVRRGSTVVVVGVLAVAAGVLIVAGSPSREITPAGAPHAGGEVPATAMSIVTKPANNSPELLADPRDPSFLVEANRLDGPQFGCALQVSGSGGGGWVPARPVPVLPAGAERCYAPEIAFDREGVLYYLFIGLHGAGNTPVGAFLTTSADHAQTFSTPRRVLPADRYMVRMALDPTVGDHGRIHLVWLDTTAPSGLGRLPPPPNPLMASHSDDGGVTFSTPVRISDPDRALAVAPALALGPDHAVHVAYYDLGDDVRDYFGLEGPVWEGHWSLVTTSSHDGGATFRPGVVVDAGVVPPERVMLIFTMTPAALVADQAGHVLAAWHDGRNGDWDVFSSRSPDGGSSWERPVRLNDDPLRDGRHQYMPHLAVAPDGRIDAVFYDRRGNVQNRGNDVYYTYSRDGGRTFAPNLRVTTLDSDSRIGPRYAGPAARGMVEFGSRIAVLSQPDRAVVAWTDTRNERLAATAQDIFVADVDYPNDAGSSSWRVPLGVSLAVAGAAALAAAVVRRVRRRSAS